MEKDKCFDWIRSRVSLMDGFHMEQELFHKMADKFSNIILDSYGCEMIQKIRFIGYQSGEYWQFQFLNKENDE